MPSRLILFLSVRPGESKPSLGPGKRVELESRPGSSAERARVQNSRLQQVWGKAACRVKRKRSLMRERSEFSGGGESMGENHVKSLCSVHVGKWKISRLYGVKSDS